MLSTRRRRDNQIHRRVVAVQTKTINIDRREISTTRINVALVAVQESNANLPICTQL